MAKGFSKVILMGNLTRDIEMRTTPSGQNVANFTLAVSRLGQRPARLPVNHCPPAQGVEVHAERVPVSTDVHLGYVRADAVVDEHGVNLRTTNHPDRVRLEVPHGALHVSDVVGDDYPGRS